MELSFAITQIAFGTKPTIDIVENGEKIDDPANSKEGLRSTLETLNLPSVRLPPEATSCYSVAPSHGLGRETKTSSLSATGQKQDTRGNRLRRDHPKKSKKRTVEETYRLALLRRQFRVG